ncbi:hypothetical protein SAMN05444157_1606 [Frankineae bacterium MT45]|nr:hypothetical protein SAMN05444157_1606 [Frankineae bacterium MT45]
MTTTPEPPAAPYVPQVGDLPEKLHEVRHVADGSATVMRVPGGWIYTILRLDQGQMNSVFVPVSGDTA